MKMLHSKLLRRPGHGSMSVMRSLTWGRILIVLVLMLALLQLLHLTLLNRLEAREAHLSKVHNLKALKEESVKLFYSMKDLIEASQIVDSAGEFKVVNSLYGNLHHNKQNGRSNLNQDITLVSQCSLNRLYQVIELVDVWQGPMSVAIFTSKDLMVLALEIILKLHECFPSIRKNVIFHLVYPLTVAPLDLPADPAYISHTCDDLPALFKEKLLAHRNYAHKGLKYPNNLLRNVGLSNVNTGYVFVIDMDMLPNFGLRESFVNFLHKHSLSQTPASRTVYVVPVFEMSHKTSFPPDKPALLKMWQQQLIRPFYHEVCWRCQKPTDYARWMNLTSSVGPLEVAYELEWSNPWEPIYIAPSNIPRYDTRFKQYGFNRISQVCELHVAGYKFAVLNNAFLVHQGLKTPPDFHLTKNVEQEHNRVIFRQFKEELKTKYTDSQRRCY